MALALSGDCHPLSDRQTGRQTDRQTDRQAGRQAGRQTGKQTETVRQRHSPTQGSVGAAASAAGS